MIRLSRRTLLGAVAASGGVMRPRLAHAAPVSHEWDKGGHRPLGLNNVEAGIGRLFSEQPLMRQYFLDEWKKVRPYSFTGPTSTFIQDGDQWLVMEFGGGQHLINVVAMPSKWDPGLSRRAVLLTMNLGPEGFAQTLVPEVCGNVAGRIIPSLEQPWCISLDALGNQVLASTVLR